MDCGRGVSQPEARSEDGMLPELRSLWHHRNNLSVDAVWYIMAKKKLRQGEQFTDGLGPSRASGERTTFSVYTSMRLIIRLVTWDI